MTMVRPTVMLGPDQLVVSATTPAAVQALAEGPTWQPAEAFVPLLNKLPAEMIYMGLSDPRASTAVFMRMLPRWCARSTSSSPCPAAGWAKAPATLRCGSTRT